MSKNLIFMRTQMYALKREYGFPADVYRVTPGVTNTETGEKSVTRVKYPVDNVIVLPNKAETIGFYAAPLLKAGRQFALGGFQDQDIKFMMIDGDDLPTNFKIAQTDYVVYEHRKYEIVTLQEVEDEVGYLIMCKHLKGEVPNEVHEAQLFQSLRLIHGGSSGS